MRIVIRLVSLMLALGLLVSQFGGVLAQSTPVASPAASSGALQSGVDWLVSQQNADGSWNGFSGTADVGASIDAVLALTAAEAAGEVVDLTSATAYLDANLEAYAESGAGQAAKAVLVTVALGENPENFAAMNPWDEMLQGVEDSTNLFGFGVYDTALVMLAHGARGMAMPESVLETVTSLQQADGSWAFDGNMLEGSGDTNTTAIMIQALVSLGMTDTDFVLHGVEYLQRTQLPQGFPFQSGAGAVADANSTGIVIQALIAAGEDPAAQEWQNVAGSMLAFQNASGSFSYLLDPVDENFFATVQAIPAVAGQPFPIIAGGTNEPVQLPTCTADQAVATPEADADLPCAA